MKLHETASAASLRLRDALHEENAFSMSGRQRERGALGKSDDEPSPDPPPSLFSEPKRSERRNEEFLVLLREADPSLSRFARAMTRDTETARDIVVETVLTALEKFDAIANKNKQAFLSFLPTIASRLYKKNNGVCASEANTTTDPNAKRPTLARRRIFPPTLRLCTRQWQNYHENSARLLFFLGLTKIGIRRSI